MRVNTNAIPKGGSCDLLSIFLFSNNSSWEKLSTQIDYLHSSSSVAICSNLKLFWIVLLLGGERHLRWPKPLLERMSRIFWWVDWYCVHLGQARGDGFSAGRFFFSVVGIWSAAKPVRGVTVHVRGWAKGCGKFCCLLLNDRVRTRGGLCLWVVDYDCVLQSHYVLVWSWALSFVYYILSAFLSNNFLMFECSLINLLIFLLRNSLKNCKISLVFLLCIFFLCKKIPIICFSIQSQQKFRVDKKIGIWIFR